MGREDRDRGEDERPAELEEAHRRRRIVVGRGSRRINSGAQIKFDRANANRNRIGATEERGSDVRVARDERRSTVRGDRRGELVRARVRL